MDRRVGLDSRECILPRRVAERMQADFRARFGDPDPDAKPVTIRITVADIRPDLSRLDALDADLVRHVIRRASAAIYDDFRAAITGEPRRSDMKPAKARRIK